MIEEHIKLPIELIMIVKKIEKRGINHSKITSPKIKQIKCLKIIGIVLLGPSSMIFSHIHSAIDTILPPQTLTSPPQTHIHPVDTHPTSFSKSFKSYGITINSSL